MRVIFLLVLLSPNLPSSPSSAHAKISTTLNYIVYIHQTLSKFPFIPSLLSFFAFVEFTSSNVFNFDNESKREAA